MAYRGDGSSGQLHSGNITGPTAAYTFHFFYRPQVAGVTGTSSIPVNLCTGTFDYDIDWCWKHSSSPKTFFQLQAAGGYASVTFSGTWNAGTGHYVTATFDGSHLRLYIDGVLNAGPTAATAPPAGKTPQLALFAQRGVSFWDNGDLAEFAFWDVCLSDPEIKSLGLGFAPPFVRPTSLKSYVPLAGHFDTVWGSGNYVLAKGGTLTAVAHPNAMYPDWFSDPLPNANNINWSMTGGIVMAGSLAVTFNEAWTPSGGIVMGGTDNTTEQVFYQPSSGIVITGDVQPAADNTWTVTGGIVMGGSNQPLGVASFGNTASADVPDGLTPKVSLTVSAGDAFLNIDSYASIDSQVGASSKFTPNSGYLASGRFREIEGSKLV